MSLSVAVCQQNVIRRTVIKMEGGRREGVAVAAGGGTAARQPQPNHIIRVSILRWQGRKKERSRESGAKVREGKIKRGMQRLKKGED